MASDYFSHDSNAQHDEKIIAMRLDHQWCGYGLYWALVERLRDAAGYKLKCQYKALAYALMTQEETLRSVIEDYGLFEVVDGHFWSESLLRRMEIKEEKSKAASNAARARWGKSDAGEPEKKEDPQPETHAMPENNAVNATAMRTHSESIADAMQVKESKVKQSKANEINNNPTTPRASAREGPDYDEPKPRSADDPELIEFFASLGATPETAASFYNHYASQGWLKPTGLPISSWKAMAHKWINEEKFNPGKRVRASPGHQSAVSKRNDQTITDPSKPW